MLVPDAALPLFFLVGGGIVHRVTTVPAVVPAVTVVNHYHHMNHGGRRRAARCCFWPLRRFSTPLISGPPQQMKRAFRERPGCLDPLLSLPARCEQLLPVVVSVIHSTSMQATFGPRRPPLQEVSCESSQILLFFCSTSHQLATFGENIFVTYLVYLNIYTKIS